MYGEKNRTKINNIHKTKQKQKLQQQLIILECDSEIR